MSVVGHRGRQWMESGRIHRGAQNCLKVIMVKWVTCGGDFCFFFVRRRRGDAQVPQALQSPGPSKFATPAQIQGLEILWTTAEHGCQNSKCQLLPRIDSCYLPGLSRSFNNSGGHSPGVQNSWLHLPFLGLQRRLASEGRIIPPACWRASASKLRNPSGWGPAGHS